MTLLPAFALLFHFAAPPADSLDAIRQDADPKHRFERALAFAEVQTSAARQLVKDSGVRAELQALLAGVTSGATLALESLRSTGLKPSKLGKQYKKGELKTREMERVLSDLALALSIEDRPMAEKARDQVAITHEEFLLGVMDK
jgi:hypothetical protein